MRHYIAQQFDTSRWKYTCNGVPTGYCEGKFESVWPAQRPAHFNIPDEDYDRWRENAAEFAHHFHAHGHATREEAEACYKQYLLDNRLFTNHETRSARSLHRCQVPGCDAYTSGNMRVGGYSLFILCDLHRNRETLEKIFEVKESWES